MFKKYETVQDYRRDRSRTILLERLSRERRAAALSPRPGADAPRG